MFRKNTGVFVLVTFLFGIFSPPLVEASAVREEYDPQHTILALNMAVMSIYNITSTGDRMVLDQEYRNILNNLSIGNIKGDDEIIKLYEKILDVITEEKLREEESRRFCEAYERIINDDIFKVLSEIQAYGGNLWSFMGSLFASAATTYFGYRFNKKEYQAELDESLWHLEKEKILEINDLRKELLRSSWKLLDQYSLPDEYLVTEENLKNFAQAVEEQNPEKALVMFQTLQKDFRAYYPFWYFYGCAAQKLGKNDLARECYATFDDTYRKVLRRDPFLVEVCKQKLLFLNPYTEREEILLSARCVAENSFPQDWVNHLVAGVHLYLFGEKEEALGYIERNIAFQSGLNVSRVFSEAMKTDSLRREDVIHIIKDAVISGVDYDLLKKELDDLPDTADMEKKRIMNELDEKMQAELPGLLEEHYKKIKEALDGAHLSEDVASMEVWWAQLKMGVTFGKAFEEDLNAMMNDLSEDVEPGKRSAQEDLANKFKEMIEKNISHSFRDAVERMKSKPEEILQRHLAGYSEDQTVYPAVTLPTFSWDDKGKAGGGMAGFRVLGGSVAVLFGKKISAKIATGVVAKVSGKALSKVIPIIGWGTLLYEFYAVADAKNSLENDFRKYYMKEYVTKVTVDSMWSSNFKLKEELEKIINLEISNWQEAYSRDIRERIDFYEICDNASDTFAESVCKRHVKGSGLPETVMILRRIRDIFSDLITSERNVDFFEGILKVSPNEKELRDLVRHENDRFLTLYEKFGQNYLEGVHRIGFQNYAHTEWSACDVDWSLVNEKLREMPSVPFDRSMAEAFFVIYSKDPSLESLDFFTPFMMSSIARRKELFVYLWDLLPSSPEKVASFFQDEAVLGKLSLMAEAYPHVVSAYVQSEKVSFWSSRSERDLVDLMKIGHYRFKKGLSGKELVVIFQNVADLLWVYRQAGEEGLALWDLYNFPGAGPSGLCDVGVAVELLRKGHSFEELQDKNKLKSLYENMY